ncbi:amino acid ABC transporter substrate-binding protein [Pseudomonas sp. N040]|uniref:amino acid ABC transporter substrate-binding protein n=1 Tax=Pseudomonas sp. N040 TaxID=2785325 RepID=UPI0018A2A4C4|nr:amino acid ABC transporter substrate-binding protein [Pseudomonas sp. N040]MBF7730055.1 amino acid ABC transporter substrate-binding protein [Pseudomonas sp. N040]MBW7013697.1 amino acid ABC transporter substrate-binding protein [Pseudomonas sp. N040]
MTHAHTCTSRTLPRLLAHALLLFGCLLPLAAAADTLQRIKDSNTFTLGFVPGYAPFSEGDSKVANGFTIDLCLQVAERVKQHLALPELRVRYQPVAIEQMLNAVADGQVDILCSPVDETLQRREQVSFSQPVITTGLGVIVRSDAPPTLLGPLQNQLVDTGPLWRGNAGQALNRFSFAVLGATRSADWARQRIRELGLKSELVLVSSSAEGIRMVADGQVDAFFDDRLVLLNSRAEQAEPERFTVPAKLFDETPAALPLARGDEDFRLLVDTALSGVFRSPLGATIYAKYFGEPSAQTRLLFRLYSLP